MSAAPPKRRERLNHGTLSAYRKGCRCEDCTAANTNACQRYRASAFGDGRIGVVCRCGERIVPCDGIDADWKHIDTNRERCADLQPAVPVRDAWKRMPA